MSVQVTVVILWWRILQRDFIYSDKNGWLFYIKEYGRKEICVYTLLNKRVVSTLLHKTLRQQAVTRCGTAMFFSLWSLTCQFKYNILSYKVIVLLCSPQYFLITGNMEAGINSALKKLKHHTLRTSPLICWQLDTETKCIISCALKSKGLKIIPSCF